MSRLSKRKTKLVFITESLIREVRTYREVMVEAHPDYAVVRLRGLRKSYPITWASIFIAAVKIDVERTRAEKRAAKKGGR